MKRLIFKMVFIVIFAMTATCFAGPSFLFDEKLSDSKPSTETNALNAYIDQFISTDALFDAVFNQKIDNGTGNATQDQQPVFDFEDDFQYFAIKAGRSTYFYEMETIDDVISVQEVQNLLADINVKNGISHLSTWTTDTPPPGSNVPEPTTAVLLGMGLIGIAGIGRRRDN